MGAKEILAYRNLAVMSARRFIELSLKEYPKDDLQDAALILAILVETERGCIHIPNTNPKLDHLDDDTAEVRNELQRTTVASLRLMAAEHRGIEAMPMVSLSLEGLVAAFAKINLAGPRFLYPPDPSAPAEQPDTQRAAVRPPAAVRLDEEEPLPYSHSEDFSMVRWYGQQFSFSPKQARVVELLWRELENQKLGLSQRTIGELTESEEDKVRVRDFRLRDVFRVAGDSERMHPAWRTMIHSVAKGIYALGPPGTSSDSE